MVLEENIYNLLFIILIIPASLLFEGIRRKLTARIQNRIGPPLFQPFYDIKKLFQKNKNEIRTNRKLLLTILSLYLLTNFSLFLFLPFSFSGFNFVLFVCIFVTSIIFYILSGILSNPFYRNFGSARDLDFMLFSGVIFTIVLFTYISFDPFLFNSLLLLKLPLASFCLFAIALLETRTKPFVATVERTEVINDAETTLNGRSLALMEISKSLRMTFFIFLITSLFFGFYGPLPFFIISLFILFLFVFIQNTNCCYRFDQIKKFLIIILLLSVIELIRINFIKW
jgi:ech hydrogenase subunit B